MSDTAMGARRLVRELAAHRAYCEGRSPLYAAVLAELLADAERGAPWVKKAVEAWSGRSFPAGWEAVHLLLAAMHYFALTGRAPELAAFYPSCGGRGGRPKGAAAGFLARAPEQFWNRLSAGLVQTNEPDRSVAWMAGAAAAFGGVDMPYHLVELGASAGLGLIGDFLPRRCRFKTAAGGRASAPPHWNDRPHPLVSRIGLDLSPRHVSNEEDRQWLRACVWADDLPRLRRLDAAVEAFLRLERAGDGPQLSRCSFLDAPDWLQTKLPASPREGLVIFNSLSTVFLGEDDYQSLKTKLAPVLSAWGRRGAWLEFERPRGAAGGPTELRLHQAAGGALTTRLLGVGAPRPVELTLTA